MAAMKHASGCESCAEAYLKLARQHEGAYPGASAITGHMPEASDRESIASKANIIVPKARIVLPAAAVAASASAHAIGAQAASQGTRLKPLPLHPTQPHSTRKDPFGVDGSTSVSAATVYGMPLNFYIGEMGYATCSNCGPCGGACFNTGTANYVGIYYTYGYWGLEGPNSTNKGSRTNYQWGQAQADSFTSAWFTGPYASYVYGQTFFCDIESGFQGWANYNYGPNQDVLNGFIDEIVANGNAVGYTFTPGVYISQGDINGPNNYWFSPSYVSSRPFVYWVTGRQTCAPCAPCNASCNTITDVENRWNSDIYHACFAGNGAVVWQYWVESCGCSGDFDYTPQSAYKNFTAVGCS